MALKKETQKHGQKVIPLPQGASPKAAGQSPSIQPGGGPDGGTERAGTERAGTDQHSNGSEAEASNKKTAVAAAATVPQFPRCNAAIGNLERDRWELADAILNECSETGTVGVRNGSDDMIKAMRREIATNLGVVLSVARLRKLRTVASAFPAGRRRPGRVSFEAHREAGTPDVLDKIIAAAPKDTRFTRKYIRQAKDAEEKGRREAEKEDRLVQIAEKRDALREQQPAPAQLDLFTGVGPSPAPESRPLPPSTPEIQEPSRPVAEALAQALRELVRSHGIDPAAETVRRAIGTFVAAVLAQ